MYATIFVRSPSFRMSEGGLFSQTMTRRRPQIPVCAIDKTGQVYYN